MPTKAILFAGQGAQSIGMGRDVAERFPAAAEVFDQANEIVGYDLKELCFEGPADKLAQTDIQQPAIFTTSVALWRALDAGGGFDSTAEAMAGLSLGEYTALHAAGAVSFADGLRLVKRRGELMQAAATASPSGMVSVMSLDADKVEAICKEACSAGPIGPANFNCPGQIVISGAQAACDLAVKLIEETGGRAVPLPVAGAFHSPFMQPAADELAKVLADTPITKPAVPVLANVNCQRHEDPTSIRDWLVKQLTHPVLWQGCIERLMSNGIEEFVEIGPGRTLTGLMKRISRRTPITNISTAEDVAKMG